MRSYMKATDERTAGEPGRKRKLLEQYGCGPIQFTGTGDALYERHLMFDNVVDAAALGPRERYEAAARSVRDVLSQRWLRTEQTYERENPKRVYYLSMEFLIGRSLANNVTPPPRSAGATGCRPKARRLDRAARAGAGCRSRERRARPPRRVLSRLDGDACSSRPWVTACAMSTASSGRRSRTAGNRSSRTTGCVGPTPGRSPGRRSRLRSSSAARSRCAAAAWA